MIIMKIRRRAFYMDESCTAYVESKENARVAGYVQHENGSIRFNVKHDDKGFSVGSGSSKSRYLFKDAIK